jgi:tRNA U55 pseudouridine synthase TruB
MTSIILYKPPGVTINQFITNYFDEKYKKENNIQKVCFTGRLDPMARGYILFLLNDECKKNNLYKSMNKTYLFKIIIGIQTDSDDPLGIIEASDFNDQCHLPRNHIEIINKLHEYLEKLKESTDFEQKFHNYSSKCIDGQPLWYYKKNKININVPTHTVSLHNYKIDPIECFDYSEWSNLIIDQITTIDKKCDFNQEKIINQWKNIIINAKLYAIPVTISVSSGFYVRQLVRDFSEIIETPLLTYDINRVAIYF